MRLSDLEQRVRGLSVEEAGRVVDEARSALTDLLEPVDDLLGSAEYKIHVTCTLLRRAIAQAAGSN
jgi:CO/xanthine dehydrogenase FAD-binding subunit